MNEKKPAGQRLTSKLIDLVSGGQDTPPGPYQKVTDPLPTPTPTPTPDPGPDPFPDPNPYFKVLPFKKRI